MGKVKCLYRDETCPCQDGCLCHYEGKNPMKPRYGLPKTPPNIIYEMLGGDKNPAAMKLTTNIIWEISQYWEFKRIEFEDNNEE